MHHVASPRRPTTPGDTPAGGQLPLVSTRTIPGLGALLPRPRAEQPAGHHATAARVLDHGLVGQHAAGLLDPPTEAPEPRTPTDQLVADLTASMQTMAGQAQLARYSDLIPYLAKTLVAHGWVEG